MRAVLLAGALLLLAACVGEQWVRLTPDEQRQLATPGIRITAITSEASPIVADLMTATEAEVLATGRPLTADELALARSLGVVEPEKVRIAVRETFPLPRDERLIQAAREYGLVLGSQDEAGRTQGHAILLKPAFAASRPRLAHELVHVAQFERLGGIEAYARQYLIELLVVGEKRAPLEQEATARQGI
jgi:hypothetical protein